VIFYQGRVIAASEAEAVEKIRAKYPGAEIRLWLALVQPFKEAWWYEYVVREGEADGNRTDEA
jgi:hypothetical protein